VWIIGTQLMIPLSWVLLHHEAYILSQEELNIVNRADIDQVVFESFGNSSQVR
jgi:hypothetical protein